MIRAVVFSGKKVIGVEIDDINFDIENIQEFLDTGEMVILCEDEERIAELFPDHSIEVIFNN